MWKYTYLYVNEDPFSEIFQPLPPAMRTHDTDGLEVTLNHLKEKSYRYNSHKDFLFRCTDKKIVLIGLELNLEATFGNYDQGFIDNWSHKLIEFCHFKERYNHIL